MIERLHQLGDAGTVVVPVDIKKIDIVGSKPLEGFIDSYAKVFGVVSGKVDSDSGIATLLSSLAVRGVLAKVVSWDT